MIVDMETGREIYIDPAAARRDYVERFQDHGRQVQAICDSLGVDYFPITTDQPMEQVLFHWVNSQQRRRARAARTGMLASANRSGGAT